MKWILFFISLAVVAVFGIYILFFTSSVPAPGSTATSTNPFGNPAGSVPVGSSTSSPTSGLPVTLTTGLVVSVPDFTQTDQPPTASAESGYQVAGSGTGDFQILYYPQNSNFLISLLSEPIGQTRIAAESALRAQLRLSDLQLCQLRIEVDTPGFVNSTYAGRNLGLSFCPGATELPN